MTISTVLIVEDDADIRMLAEMALGDIGGLEVRVVEDGSLAMNAVNESRPDVILMDVMMPVMTGPEALEALKANPETRDIPVVFMTAKSEHDQLELYTDMGALDVIVKPFDPMSLAERLQQIVSENNR